MVRSVSEVELRSWSACLMNPNAKLVDRSHALWGLRHANEPLAMELIAVYVCDHTINSSPSANDLLQHEAAYCLGQRKDPNSLPYLFNIIQNENHSPIVRHEAGEALAALADNPTVDLDRIEQILKQFQFSPIVELAETCQIGLHRLEWIRSKQKLLNIKSEPDLATKYFPNTIDPVPSFGLNVTNSDQELNNLLMDPDQSLFTRYQALFTLRDRILQAFATNSSPKHVALLMADGLLSKGSALLRHEVAFVLGQLALPCTIPQLTDCVKSVEQHPMVRHEAAEALGSVLGVLESKCVSDKCTSEKNSVFQSEARQVLEKFTKDPEAVVRESCILALDIADYVASSDRFQYASVPDD